MSEQKQRETKSEIKPEPQQPPPRRERRERRDLVTLDGENPLIHRGID